MTQEQETVSSRRDEIWQMVVTREIDFEAIARTVDLGAIIAADLGAPTRGKWKCPFHADTNPSLSLTPDKKHFKCWSCLATGDAADYIAGREGITLGEAARRLDPFGTGSAGDYKPTAPRPADAPEKSPAWRDAAWQAIVGVIVRNCSEALWSNEGRPALDWLRRRGLADHTIRRFRLGWNARDYRTKPIEVLGDDRRGQTQCIWVNRGVTIPWLAPESYPDEPVWVGCNVRRLAGDMNDPTDDYGKCRALSGSTRGYLYPWPEILPPQAAVPVLLVEGEIDALLGWQEAGWIAHTGTVGGANQSPHPTALSALARCSWWLLAFDRDEAGVRAVREWKARAPHKSRRLMLPHGKDLGEFVQAGGDVRAWLAEEWERFGWTAKHV